MYCLKHNKINCARSDALKITKVVEAVILHQNVTCGAQQSRAKGDLPERRCIKLFQFSFALFRFCSKGILEERVRFRTSRAEGMHFIIKDFMSKILQCEFS